MSYRTDRHSKKGTKAGMARRRQVKRLRKRRGSRARAACKQMPLNENPSLLERFNAFLGIKKDDDPGKK